MFKAKPISWIVLAGGMLVGCGLKPSGPVGYVAGQQKSLARPSAPQAVSAAGEANRISTRTTQLISQDGTLSAFLVVGMLLIFLLFALWLVLRSRRKALHRLDGMTATIRAMNEKRK